MRYLWLLALLALPLCPGWAQDIPVGTWRVHPGISDVRQVERMGNYLYVSGTNSFFQIDLADNSLMPLSKADGLSDVGISALRYHPTLDALIIGYRSGNIDIIRNGKITSLNALSRFSTTVSRAIKHISTAGNNAYLSTDFGLVILDVARGEIRGQNTALGSTGANRQIASIATAILRDSLYVLTAEGLKVARLTANLQNTNNYTTLGADRGLPTTGGAGVAAYQNLIYVSFPGDAAGRGLYRGTTSGFGQVVAGAQGFNGFEQQGDSLFAITNWGHFAFGPQQGSYTFYRPQFRQLLDIAKLPNGHRFFADAGQGLFVQDESGVRLRQLNGPITDLAFRLYSHGNRVLLLSGGYEPSTLAPAYSDGGFSLFEDGQWTNYSPRLGNFPDYRDLVDALYDERNNLYYLASFGAGVAVWDPETKQVLRKYDDTNSPLPNYATGDNVRVTGVFGGYNGERFFINTAVIGQTVHKQEANGNFTLSTGLPGVGARAAVRGLAASNGTRWIAYANNQAAPLFVFNEATGQSRVLSNATNAGGLPGSGLVYDLAQDLDGSIWVAMAQGFGVFYNPGAILGTAPVNISLPIYGGRPVLENDAITSLFIDGAGRKWVGTRDNGVYLFDKDVTRIELHFTKENSPLPSNEVIDITVNGTTGEVFIGTTAGLASYRSNATFGNFECKEVKVFPAPVRRDFAGLVTLSNLPAASSVKITDISGKLAYEGTSAGGSFSWNMRDYNGAEVVSGVYLAYVSTADGQLSCVTRMAIIR